MITSNPIIQTLLAEIREDASVFGSFIQHQNKGLIFSDLPSVFRAEKLSAFSSHIRRFFLLGNIDGGFEEMEFSYGEMMVVSRPVNPDYLLVTFCSPDANAQPIHLKQKILLPELWTAIASQPDLEQVQIVGNPPLPQKKTLLFMGVSYGDRGPAVNK